MGSNSVLIKENFDECLKEVGMKIQHISNDGNCFFRAISDQLYGHQDQHHELRKVATGYMGAHPQEFIPWIVVGSGSEGELRRSAGRAAKRSAPKGAVSSKSLSQEETDRVANATYKQYVDNMSKDGKWGGEHEMKAIANAMHINILVYSKKNGKASKEFAEVLVECNESNPLTQTAKIIRHEYNHFSSVRPMHPQSGDWSGLRPQARETQARETPQANEAALQANEAAQISKPNAASVVSAPQPPTSLPQTPSKKPQTKASSETSLPTPPCTPEGNPSPPRKSQKTSSTSSSSPGSSPGSSKKATAKPITSKLSSATGARVTKKPISKPKKTVHTASEPKYMYPGEKSPMTRTAMRMKCGFLGKNEEKLFKLVEKKEDGSVKRYTGDQKITIVKGVKELPKRSVVWSAGDD